MKKVSKILLYTLLSTVLVAVILFFWASSPTSAEQDYSKVIRNNFSQELDNDSIYSIVTYNIGYLSSMTNNKAIAKPKSLFENNLQQVTKAFKIRNADIIAFQEIDYASKRSYTINQQNEIAKLGYNYIAQAVNWDETYVPFPYWPPSVHFGSILSGQSIVSKFPLKDHHRIVLERVKDNPFYRDAFYLERLAQVVKAIIENKDVIIINVHLESYDKPTRGKQMNDVIELFNTYRKEYPTILLGDFNSEARKPDAFIHELIKLPNVGNAVFTKENPANTFSSADPFKRIDYIFYSENSIEYIDGKVLSQFGQASDHLPVEMWFKLK